MAREVTARDLADLGDERFEQLIASIVLAEEPDAERPAAPDGGADVLVPASGARRARVWQVKHYPNDIAWKKCEISLDDAVTAYAPSEIVFVFPRNLSKPLRNTFEERLARRSPNVVVRLWGLTRIQEKLAAHPEIALRYFGEDREDVLAGVLRAVKQGGEPLETTRDLADRVFALDTFADDQDPSFEYKYSFGSNVLPNQPWDDSPPFMVVHEIRGERRMSTEAWLRPEAQASAGFTFTDDADGARARSDVREGIAAGRPVEVSSGIVLVVDNAPVAAREVLETAENDGFEHEKSTISPPDSFDLTLRLGKAEGAPEHRFAVRSIPPLPGSQLAVGSVGNGLALFADFVPSESDPVQMKLRLGIRPVREPAVNAKAARFLLEYLNTDVIVCLADDLPADGLTVTGSEPRSDDQTRDHLKLSIAYFDAITLIEQNLGSVEAPYPFGREDYEQAMVAAAALGTRTGTFTFTELSIDLEPHEVDAFVASAQAGHPGRHPLRVPLFGRELEIGIAEFATPPIMLVYKEPSEQPGKTKVVLRTKPVSMPFRLVDDEPPAATSSSRLWTPGDGPAGLVQLE